MKQSIVEILKEFYSKSSQIVDATNLYKTSSGYLQLSIQRKEVFIILDFNKYLCVFFQVRRFRHALSLQKSNLNSKSTFRPIWLELKDKKVLLTFIRSIKIFYPSPLKLLIVATDTYEIRGLRQGGARRCTAPPCHEKKIKN